MTPTELFHIAEPADWERAGADYRPPSLDDEGFIHLSAADQVEATTRRHYDGRADLLLLTIDVGRLDGAEIRWQGPSHGEDHPHLYGPLPVAAVTLVRPWPA